MELCPCLVLGAFDSLLPCEAAVPVTHRHKGKICTKIKSKLGRRLRVQVRRTGVAGTILPEGKGVEGAACHPEQLKLLPTCWHRITLSFLLPRHDTGTSPT